MKCPVCDNENTSAVCIRCGFDASRDYEHYPTLAPVGQTPTVSDLRRQWQEKQSAPVLIPTPPKPEPKKKPWLMIAACAAMLALGIGIGVGLGSGNAEPTEPEDTVQMQQPPETTTPPETTVPPEVREANVLRSDIIPDPDNDGYYGLDEVKAYSVFGSDYQRQQICSVVFLDTLTDMPSDAWDVSEAGNGKVMAWVEYNLFTKPNEKLYTLYIGAEGGVWAGESCKDLFAGYVNVFEIIFGDAFHTENVQTMNTMFGCCEALTSLDLSSFDTANVQDMWGMFGYCEALNSLKLGNRFDTANVQTMNSMFGECHALTSLNLSSFDTTNVQDMEGMFFYCENLTSLNLSSFDTANVQNMQAMFMNCVKLASLELGNRFDTANVQNMNGMFAACWELTSLELGNRFVTTNANTTNMFYDCPAGSDYQHLLH